VTRGVWAMKLFLFATITCSTSESRVQASRAPHQLQSPLSTQRTMAQHKVTQLPLNEADIQLAIVSINSN
jgi:hypothetical protein